MVWCPKYRRKILTGDIKKRFKEIIIKITKELQSEIIEFEIIPDHVHLLVEVDP